MNDGDKKFIQGIMQQEIEKLAIMVQSGFVDTNSRIAKVSEDLQTFKQEVNARFEAIDKRFDEVDKRFEAVDKRFEEINERFTLVDKRFDEVDKRFDIVDSKLDMYGYRIENLERDVVGIKIG